MLLDQEQMEELAFVRSALEIAAAERAAEIATPEQTAQLQATVEAQRAAAQTRAYVDHDVAFHQQLAAIVGNPILIDLLSTVRSLLRVWSEHAVDLAEDVEAAIREHAEVAEAIAAADPAAAGAAMRRHMTTATARILRAAGRS